MYLQELLFYYSGLMLSNTFQSYVYANSISKLTSVVYNSSKEVVSNGK